MYFEIVSASGGYRAHLKSNNHKLVWWTEVYTNKSGAEWAIELAKQSANARTDDET